MSSSKYSHKNCHRSSIIAPMKSSYLFRFFTNFMIISLFCRTSSPFIQLFTYPITFVIQLSNQPRSKINQACYKTAWLTYTLISQIIQFQLFYKSNIFCKLLFFFLLLLLHQDIISVLGKNLLPISFSSSWSLSDFSPDYLV